MLKKMSLLLAVVLTAYGCSMLEPPDEFTSTLQKVRSESVDKTPPYLKVLYPVYQFYFMSGFTVSNEVYDDFGIDRVEVSYDGTNWFQCIYAGNDVYYREFTNLNEGIFNVRVRAVDLAGNSSEDFFQVAVVKAVCVSTNGSDDSVIPSKQTPFRTIQKALNYAVAYGINFIWVSEGHYTFDRTGFSAIDIPEGIKIIGGFSSDFSEYNPDFHPTVFDGEGKVSYVVSAVGLDSNSFTLLDGVVITGAGNPTFGEVRGIYAYSSYLWLNNVKVVSNLFSSSGGGGGILAKNSHIFATNLTVSENSLSNSSLGGAGVSLFNSHLCGSNIVICSNFSDDKGGGLWGYGDFDLEVSGLKVFGNSADSGGGIYLDLGQTTLCELDFKNGEVFNNSGRTAGAGVYISASLDNSIVQINNLKVMSNFAVTTSLNGGGIYATQVSNLILSNVVMISNRSAYGGGVYFSKNLRLISCVVSSNTATAGGGGVYLVGSPSIRVVDSVVSYNETFGYAGGIYGSSLSGFIIRNSRVENNRCVSSGAGIYISGSANDSANEVSNSFIGNNVSDGADGGGVYLYDYKLKVVDSSISSNHIGTNGGGFSVYGTSSYLIFNGVDFVSNSAGNGYGGGIYIYAGSVYITNSAFSSNSAGTSGGAWFTNTSGVSLDSFNVSFADNSPNDTN